MAGSDHWNTPLEIISWLREFNRGPIALDPCSNKKSSVGALLEWCGPPGADGLFLPWPFKGLVFVNPPYSNKLVWMRKCWDEARRSGKRRMDIIALVPADTDTDHFHRYCFTATRRCFIRGRVVHTGVKAEPQPARFPSVLVYWNFSMSSGWQSARTARFEKVFGCHGALC